MTAQIPRNRGSKLLQDTALMLVEVLAQPPPIVILCLHI
jgi:hypothetical protein